MSKVVARDEDTAFLTKHLRCYGGTGQYDGYSIARALKNITFHGNAFTKRPANPDSIIFAKENKKIILTSGVNLNKEEIIMSDNILEKQVAELYKEQVKQLTQANRELGNELILRALRNMKAKLFRLKIKLQLHKKL